MQFWDQNALNAVLVHQWIELPEHWNTQSEALFQALTASTSGALMDPAIVHFTTGVKPWHWSGNHPFKHEYHKYRIKTPWRSYQQEGRPPLPKKTCPPMFEPASGPYYQKKFDNGSDPVFFLIGLNNELFGHQGRCAVCQLTQHWALVGPTGLYQLVRKADVAR